MISNQRAIMIDIDGTLANIDHRREKLLKNNNWEEFNKNMKLDEINLWCLEIINKFKADYKILLLTGRKEEFKEVTLNWLSKNNVYFDEIFFRKDNDFESDDLLKETIYKQKIKDNFDILFVVDDRLKVVKKWRELGLVCLQCDFGDY